VRFANGSRAIFSSYIRGHLADDAYVSGRVGYLRVSSN
jgi:hypothetical protein